MPSSFAARSALALLALLLAAPAATLAQSRPAAYPNPNYGNSWLGSSRPSQTAFRPQTQTYRPAPGAALPTMPVRPSSASTGYATTRPTTSSWGSGPTFASGGYSNRMRPSGAMPYVMGALAGTAAYNMLSRNRDATCNGYSVACYKSACQRAMEQCPKAAGKQLGLVRCPSSPTLPTYTECYTTRDVSFVCLGRPRPTQSANIDAYCSEASTPTPAPQSRPAAPAPAPTSSSKPEEKPAAAPAPVPYANEDVGVQGAQSLELVADTGDAPAPTPAAPQQEAPSQQQLQQAQQQRPTQQGQQQQDGGGIGTAAFLAAAAGLLLAAGH